MKKLQKTSTKDKVERLEHLLEKSIAYSKFLADKIKKEGDAGTTSVADGSVKGVGLSQPALIEGSMRPYQLMGVHWLVGLYENGLNGILGDEMGLGKTVQSISMLAHLATKGVNGPFLVVGPLSTVHNWQNEFRKWTPTMEAVVYHGDKKTRETLLGTHWRAKGGKDAANQPVMITSFEVIIRDIAKLRKINWKFIIIDEGHRLKNMNCRLLRDLKTLGIGADGSQCNRLLLTGTPLQNNLTELWSLLNFLLPSIFDDLDAFQAWFDFDFSKEETAEKIVENEMQHSIVTKLHLILRPFLLRRLKQDVELELPRKYEYLLFAWMTDWQSAVYTDVINKQLHGSDGKSVSVNNVLMQLRKCCNHPFLFEWPLDDAGEEVVDSALVDASGKMQLLDRILNELKRQGDHQVLIFSQMTRMLDILEDYLVWKKHRFRRLDGSVAAEDRRKAMEEFQTDEEIFVFLLSTRAGGLGINLMKADTVIIFDSDWNPHADLQAQDRAHRIGQKKTVMVYRLATAATVEEKVLDKAKAKLKLEQLVVSKGKFKDIGKQTDKNDTLQQKELLDLLAYDPSKAALGKDETNKVITDDELMIVLDRSQDMTKLKGKGFMLQEKTVSSFDAFQRGGS
jgi:ATP-dependent DNA helicase